MTEPGPHDQVNSTQINLTLSLYSGQKSHSAVCLSTHILARGSTRGRCWRCHITANAISSSPLGVISAESLKLADTSHGERPTLTSPSGPQRDATGLSGQLGLQGRNTKAERTRSPTFPKQKPCYTSAIRELRSYSALRPEGVKVRKYLIWFFCFV